MSQCDGTSSHPRLKRVKFHTMYAQGNQEQLCLPRTISISSSKRPMRSAAETNSRALRKHDSVGI